MSRSSMILVTLLMLVAFFTFGWAAYPALLDLMLPEGVDVIAQSAEEALLHRALSAVSMAAFGISTNLGARMALGASASYVRHGVVMILLALSGLAATTLWFWLGARPVVAPAVVWSLPLSLPLADLPVHEVGIFSGIGCLALTTLLWLVRLRDTSGKSGHG